MPFVQRDPNGVEPAVAEHHGYECGHRAGRHSDDVAGGGGNLSSGAPPDRGSGFFHQKAECGSSVEHVRSQAEKRFRVRETQAHAGTN